MNAERTSRALVIFLLLRAYSYNVYKWVVTYLFHSCGHVTFHSTHTKFIPQQICQKHHRPMPHMSQDEKIREIHRTEGAAIEEFNITSAEELHALIQEIKIFPDGTVFRNRAKFIELILNYADELNSEDISILLHKSAFLSADKTIASRSMEAALINANAVAAYSFSRRLQKQLPLTLKVLERDFDLIMSIPISQLSDSDFTNEIATRYPYRMGWAMEFSRQSWKDIDPHSSAAALLHPSYLNTKTLTMLLDMWAM